jgi:CheY-like chemotaxis protein
MSLKPGNGRDSAEEVMGTVLFIDDEEDIVLFLQTVLEDSGSKALTASSASEGLRLIRKEKVDLVCIDVLMPEESGISFYKKLKTNPEFVNMPVIIMSGLTMSRELGDLDYLKLPDGAVLAEPEGFIDKPVDVDLFLSLVGQTIRADR